MSQDIKNIITKSGYWRVIIRPVREFYKKDRLSFPEIREVVRQAKVSKRGWDYPHVDSGSLPPNSTNSIASEVQFEGHNEFWEFTTSGQFSHILSLGEDTWVTTERAEKIKQRAVFNRDQASQAKSFLEVVSTVYRLTEIYLFASNLSQFEGLIKVGAWEIIVELHGSKGRMLYFEEFMRDLHSPYICKFDSIPFKDEFSREKLIANSNEIALEKAIKTFEFFGWEEPNRKALTEDQRKLLEMRF